MQQTNKTLSPLSNSSSKESNRAFVEGDSMWPVLRDRFLIEYSSDNPSYYNSGDILVLRRPDGRTVVHRLIGRVGPYFIEAGDNSLSASIVLATDVIGKVFAAYDQKKEGVCLQENNWQRKRFYLFMVLAYFFIFIHQTKERILGQRKSKVLWRLSVMYRTVLGWFGLIVPNIPPYR